MRILCWSIRLVILVGCGRVNFDDNGPRSGTRLKLQWVEFDGTRIPTARFYDAERDEQCTPTYMADGELHCAPQGIIVPSVRFYADPACSVEVVSYGSSCETPRYVATFDTLPCRPFTRLRPLGDSLGPALVYTRFSDGTCQGPTQSGGMMFPVSAEVDPAEFSKLHVEVLDGPGRARHNILHAVDGFRADSVADFYDAALDAHCVLQIDPASDYVCTPRAADISNRYHDAACTQPKAASYIGCTDERFAIRPSNCGWELFRATPLPAEPIYMGDTNACLQIMPEAPSYYGITEPLDMMKVALVPRSGTGRITPVILAAPGASVVTPRFAYDRQLATLCDITPSATCVPSRRASVNTYFTDAACTQPIELAVDDTLQCGKPLPTFAANPETCTGGDIYRIGAVHTDPVYQIVGTSCLAVTRSPIFRVDRVFDLPVGTRVVDE